MPTLNYLTGFEWPGVTTITATGAGLVAGIVTNAPTVDAAAARTGSYGMRVNNATSITKGIDITVTAGLACGRFYMQMVSLPETGKFPKVVHLGSTNAAQVFISDAGVMSASIVGGASTTAKTLTTGVWYRIDFSLDVSGTTHTSMVWVDGDGPYTASTGSLSADADTTLAFGCVNGTSIWDVYFDDLIVSSTLADAPFGEGQVLAYVPSGAASHQSITLTEWATTSDFSSFTNFTASDESTSAPLLDDLTAGTDGIQVQGGAGAVAGNARWATALLSGTNPGTPPQAVRGIAVHQDEASGTNNIIERIELGGSTADIFNGNPAASWEYRASIFTATPAAGTWTYGDLASLNIEVDSTDSNPDTFIGGVLLEVAFSTEPPPSLVTAARV